MKTKLIITAIAIVLSLTTFAQKKSVQVLYFKANLGCCMAKSCNALEADVQKVITANFPKGNVTFTEVKLVEPVNADLVKKYQAKSQTVVLVKGKAGKETSLDVSNITREYIRNQDYAAFEKALTAKIKEFIK